MTDLDQRIRRDLAAIATTIEPAATPGQVIDHLRRAPTRRASRAAVALVATAVVVIIIGAVTIVRRPPPADVIDVGDTTTTMPARGTTVAVPVAGTWRDLPSGPLQELWPRASAWTGRELIVWRGENGTGRSTLAPLVDRSASFDLASQTWTMLPPDPMGDPEHITETTGVGTGAVFANGEALFWAAEGMVAWNPQTSSWRSPADPPRSHDHDGVWTGREVLFPLDGLAYDPTTDAWREISRPPAELISSVDGADHGVLFAEDMVVVVGGQAGVYDPTDDSWRSLPAPGPRTIFLVDGQIIARSPGSSWTLDLRSDTWRLDPAADPGIAPCEGAPTIIPFGDGDLFASSGCDSAAWHPRGGAWQPAPFPTGALIAGGPNLFSYGTTFSIYEPVPR